MRLGNIRWYLAEVLDIPESAIEIKLYWPHKGILNEVTEREMGKHVLTELRDVWRAYRQ